MMSGVGPAGGALSRRQTSKGPLTEPTVDTLPSPRPQHTPLDTLATTRDDTTGRCRETWGWRGSLSHSRRARGPGDV
ncbi:unnamed protein product [Danaus chrysippus]|uniref:(African queen) hypothetical protein n=1 Tax=Danaus chrysippus TaxID=151541 RepID=A0A8J2R7Q1_9NEOP|nr:unnamed protein product [Danaus chrysippus]